MHGKERATGADGAPPPSLSKREQRSADVAGYAYARGALQAAINIHDFFGESSGSQGGVRPAPGRGLVPRRGRIL